MTAFSELTGQIMSSRVIKKRGRSLSSSLSVSSCSASRHSTVHHCSSNGSEGTHVLKQSAAAWCRQISMACRAESAELCDSNDPDAASHARADVHPSEEAKAVIPNTLVVLAVGTTGTGKSFALSGDIRIRKAPAHQQPVSPVPARQTGPADQLASNTSTLTATSAGTTTSPQIVFRSNWGMIPLTLAWLFDRHGHVYQETNEEATPFSVQMTMHEYRKGPVAGTNRSSENQQKRVLLSETFTREQDALMQFVKANGNRQTASRGDQIGQQVRSGESSRSWSVLIIVRTLRSSKEWYL